MSNSTTVDRISDREVVITRTFNAPARLVFEAWTRPELMSQWWVPTSCGFTGAGVAVGLLVGVFIGIVATASMSK